MTVSDSPHITDEYTPLRELAGRVINLVGDFSPSSVEGEIAAMMIGFANLVVDEWNFHPYLEDEESSVDHYRSVDERREIPDQVMRAGMLAYYSAQQGHGGTAIYQAQYYQTLNREAYRKTTGGVNPKLEMTETR